MRSTAIAIENRKRDESKKKNYELDKWSWHVYWFAIWSSSKSHTHTIMVCSAMTTQKWSECQSPLRTKRLLLLARVFWFIRSGQSYEMEIHDSGRMESVLSWCHFGAVLSCHAHRSIIFVDTRDRKKLEERHAHTHNSEAIIGNKNPSNLIALNAGIALLIRNRWHWISFSAVRFQSLCIAQSIHQQATYNQQTWPIICVLLLDYWLTLQSAWVFVCCYFFFILFYDCNCSSSGNLLNKKK